LEFADTAGPGNAASRSRWRFAGCELDEFRQLLHVDGVQIELDRSSFDLLLCLLRNAGQVVGKDELLRAGWPARVVSENSLVKAISRLRQALNDKGELLRVVSGYGYRLVADVERATIEGAPAVDPPPPSLAPAPASPPMADPEPLVTPTGRRSRWVAVIAASTILLAVAWASLRTEQAPGDSPPVAIAVLPFIDLSSEQDQLHFSDGLAEELLDNLARLPQLRVVGRTSSFAYRGKDIDVPSIGRALNAEKVLEGSVRKSGERLRVTVQLINSADGYHEWSQTFDRHVTELFAL
jgi:TolB-like protein/DNA-binding winged helix-turn-helix (wHTH) protein